MEHENEFWQQVECDRQSVTFIMLTLNIRTFNDLSEAQGASSLSYSFLEMMIILLQLLLSCRGSNLENADLSGTIINFGISKLPLTYD